ncbi:MAG TPA: hypothetical protein DIT65_07925, partial [Cryomorphaceae bacterium]|nr:hypothetical protein [Cryomorphaceae bacterium]
GAQDLDYFTELNAPLSFGDSRFNALAGNMVGMSGSLTALALNPATVGLYRQDAFSVSGNVFNSRNRSTTGGTLGNSNNLNVGSTGFVARDLKNGWHVFFSYNTDQLYRGRLRNNEANGGSILSQFINNAAGTPPDYLPELGPYEDMMYQSYAVDYNSNTGNYFAPANLFDVNTKHLYFRRGMRNRWTIGTGKGLTQRFYVGGSLSFIYTFETVEIAHEESFNQTTDLTDFTMEEWWKNSAAGITGNVGFYYRPVQFLRIAAAFELPSIYAFIQDWETKFRADRPSISTSGITAEGFGEMYEWSMMTAPKLRGGITLVAGRKGLLTVNYTYAPTAAGRMISRNERYLNETIDSLLAPVQQIGTAGELRFGILTLQAGATVVSSAQEQLGRHLQVGGGVSIKSDRATYNVSFGSIVRNKQYFMYSADFTNAVDYSNTLSVLSTGVTFKF